LTGNENALSFADTVYAIVIQRGSSATVTSSSAQGRLVFVK